MSIQNITLYTDGAYSVKTKTGGYAYFLKSDKAEKLVHGQIKEGPISAPRMELLAAILGLEAIRIPAHVIIICDATYVTQPINLERGYDLSCMVQNPDRPNLDLWLRLKRASEFHLSLTAQYVKSHSGNRYNDLVDEHAKKEAGTWTEKCQRSKDKQNLQRISRRSKSKASPEPKQ